MPKYRIELAREVNLEAYLAIEVEANSREEAEAQALAKAQDGKTPVNWELDHDDWWDTEGEIRVLDTEEVSWPDGPDSLTHCGCCGIELDMSQSGPKTLGCGECDKEFCSGECYDKHVAKSGHDS